MAITFDAKKNFAYSVVATAPAPATTGTSLVVAPGDGANFPTAPFNAVIWPTGVQPTTTNAEVVRVTNVAVDTLTIVREQEGTTARTVIVNDQIAVNITAKSLTDIEAAFTTASQLAAPIGAVVMWFADTAPTGWLFLRGQAISRATYSALFALWGVTFGAGDGVNTFNVINMQAKIPIGRDTTGTHLDLDSTGEESGTWNHAHGPGTLQVEGHVHGPGTLTVASHTHGAGTLTVASHTHGPGTLSAANHTHGTGTLVTSNENLEHSHGMAHTHSLSGHTHSFSETTTGSGTDSNTDGGSASGTIGDHTHDVSGDTGVPSIDATGASSEASTDGMSDNVIHGHTISGDTDAAAPAISAGVTGSTAPAVNAGATAATAPAVTLGATAGTAPVVSAGTSGTANPPVRVANFIVRALLEI